MEGGRGRAEEVSVRVRVRGFEILLASANPRNVGRLRQELGPSDSL